MGKTPSEPKPITSSAPTIRTQPGSAKLTRIYCAGIFIGRITGQSVYDCTGRLRSGDDFDAAVVVGDHVLGAGVQRGFDHLVFAGTWRKHDLAAMLEEVRDRAIGAEIPAVLGECVAHVSDGFAPQTNIVRQDGHRGVLMSVLKAGNASTLDVVEGIRQRLADYQDQAAKLSDSLNRLE